MLEIENIHAEVDGRPILRGINLSIEAGRIHAIMGPNGSGKSTLTYVLTGRESCKVTQGSISFCGRDLLSMEPDERAIAGLFLAMQYPVELPGVSGLTFLREAVNARRKVAGEELVDSMEFLKMVRSKANSLGVSDEMLKRSVNVGFSGGEKKRNEILQMAMLEPRFCILDETDSGLDIDALKVVSDGVNSLRSSDRSMLVITHYQRLLDYIEPDLVHVLAHGRIQKTGGKELALQLEQRGYINFIETAA
ncbi:feS assembly ATPase SufC [Candidatus Endolissoclinum faulkneri L5]|uniref:FeS assembly ATPase SufC n=1 Tax=Candidatus Endolissoclinum faulkneri L5 TaxID=1401328 RepID=V9TX60_9PROT|nr:Fe-S cluster assembly ATPase SufC [Candidatus Endolissoclinum faulkneri]AHC73920.1 feS assembly ATPase SufC [Candidatus Endolissoclinum faulkneri L5]